MVYLEIEMSSVNRRPFSGTSPLIALLFGSLCASLSAQAAPLSLDQAEALALLDEPSVLSIQAERQALSELAVAAEQLPDPLLKLGLINMPVDGFDLRQEPMTQMQLGLSQRFPRGRSRSLRKAQIELHAQAYDERASDRRLQITLSVREAYLDVMLQRKLLSLTQNARVIFSDLAEITQDYYASGRAQQQEVLRSVVELNRIEDRLTGFSQAEETARASLYGFIADAAYQDFADNWPTLPPVRRERDIREDLKTHPRIQSLQRQMQAAETGVELADQRYKPEFALDVRYGGRGGYNPDGSARSDLLSVMLTMDLPLFRNNRQDRVSAAKIAESSAAVFNRDDVLRSMDSTAAALYRRMTRQRERLSLYRSTLLPQASFSADASFEAYQSSVGDLTALMRARITEYELQLEHARLEAEERITMARLLYLQGDAS
jgi:outer membrane protein TolC